MDACKARPASSTATPAWRRPLPVAAQVRSAWVARCELPVTTRPTPPPSTRRECSVVGVAIADVHRPAAAKLVAERLAICFRLLPDSGERPARRFPPGGQLHRRQISTVPPRSPGPPCTQVTQLRHTPCEHCEIFCIGKADAARRLPPRREYRTAGFDATAAVPARDRFACRARRQSTPRRAPKPATGCINRFAAGPSCPDQRRRGTFARHALQPAPTIALPALCRDLTARGRLSSARLGPARGGAGRTVPPARLSPLVFLGTGAPEPTRRRSSSTYNWDQAEAVSDGTVSFGHPGLRGRTTSISSLRAHQRRRHRTCCVRRAMVEWAFHQIAPNGHSVELLQRGRGAGRKREPWASMPTAESGGTRAHPPRRGGCGLLDATLRRPRMPFRLTVAQLAAPHG